MESLPTIVPTDTADDQTTLEPANDGGDGVYYECKEHRFVVVGAPASDGSDDYIDEQIDEHERQHAHEARARGAQPAIALDGDSVVFGEVAAAPVSNGRDLHRKIVASDLADLAEHALEHEDDHRPGTREWEVLRTAADAAQALAELLPAAEAHGIESRDLAALGDHALSVLASVIELATREAVAS
ncbi:hypothetical protein [Agrococcus sp. Marseille-Q4369]|uniref:hypothetical protein n=1 Tax=Agrococcus sp. Marseille-Q4369 TaxID=2810513 RepID=UPI001B8C973E|nr:hypothetical protein [Agrococcus sp. Marseille-Q4369]QUW18858.1 hypothetical protein JSQ78_00280 [Agrococcus sp. Marseille-Q4369]